MQNRSTHCLASAALAALLISLPAPVRAQAPLDDTLLFSNTVAPNVLILADTSGSMDTVVYHPSYDADNPGATCGFFGSDQSFSATASNWDPGWTPASCASSRTIPVDAANADPVLYEAAYLNWLFSPGNATAASQVATQTVTYPCIGETYLEFGRSRMTATKQILREVVCQVNQSVDVRFGLARFRYDDGGYVVVPLANYSAAQDTAIDAAITTLPADGYTPLAESLFQAYTYFMPPGDLPDGVTTGTSFPAYRFDSAGTWDAALSVTDPVTASCQKHFVIVITDGLPTRDGFGTDGDATQKFDEIASLVGEYDGVDLGSYLNDVAKFMHEKDFRPDLDDPQTIDVYTVGFSTTDAANDLLERTALVGGGEFYESDDPEELTQNLIDALTHIVSKSQSFTAATVPASRTTDGENIYMSYFVPKPRDPVWPGHLVNFGFSGSGQILDANGDCAVDDGSGDCLGGDLDPGAVPYWDAAGEIPAPGSRLLYLSKSGVASGALPPAFSAANVSAADLGVAIGDIASYPASGAADAEELADEIVGFVRGCVFGDATCATPRPDVLGDIFHSNPIVAGPPNSPVNEASYREFARNYAHRDRVIYAGANDGFLHAFHAGEWVTSPSVGYDRGTGDELFGFMPWQVRQSIKEYPIDLPPRDHYFVDGSPQMADVWFYPTATTDPYTRSWDEWHTLLVGGLRQGGTHYYALDVTNSSKQSVGSPGYPAYPSYLWEFPCEADVASCNAVRPFMGETWGDPVITRVRVTVDCVSDCPVYERWVAIVTGGFHPSGDPNDFANYDANATAGRAIYMIDVATGELLARKQFDAGASAGEPELEMTYAIAQRPAVFDLDSDGYADVVYVGDLGGNVWKWVVRPPGGDPIHGSGSADLVSQPSWPFKKFFAAPSFTDGVSGSTFYKSFFYPPTGTLHQGRLLLGFASGERHNLTANFVPSEDGDNNRIYVVSDLDPYENLSTPYATLTESDLENLTDSPNCVDASTHRGYYVVGRDAEKFVTNGTIFLGDFFTGSFVPNASADPCQARGDSYLYRFDLVCGDGSFDPATAGSTQPEDLRRVRIGTGLPAPPRFSVGPAESDGDDDDDPPPCSNRVLVLTSDGNVDNQCGGETPNAGVKPHTWRLRE